MSDKSLAYDYLIHPLPKRCIILILSNAKRFETPVQQSRQYRHRSSPRHDTWRTQNNHVTYFTHVLMYVVSFLVSPLAYLLSCRFAVTHSCMYSCLSPSRGFRPRCFPSFLVSFLVFSLAFLLSFRFAVTQCTHVLLSITNALGILCKGPAIPKLRPYFLSLYLSVTCNHILVSHSSVIS